MLGSKNVETRTLPWNGTSSGCCTAQPGDCQIALNTAPSRGSTPKRIFTDGRNRLPGVCIFCDGPDHDQPVRKESDQRERRLGDIGYRIVTIRDDSDLRAQLAANQDVFGAGNQPYGACTAG